MGFVFQKIFAIFANILRFIIALLPGIISILLKAIMIPFQLLAASVGPFWAIIIILIILSSIMGGVAQQ